jgi:7-cyano-7-deazaguanine synthase
MNWNPTSPDINSLNPVGSKAIVLLSGGMDSVMALAEVLHQGVQVVQAITFNYGQRARTREIESASNVARHFGIPHEVIDLPWLAQLLPQALTPDSGARMDEDGALNNTKLVWVPNRNGVFLNIAAAIAEAHGAKYVVFGANADEAVGFPDNTEEYRLAANQALAFSTLSSVQVLAPVGHLSKAEIIRLGIARQVPLELIWSCYEGTEQHCGVCPSCIRFRQALKDAGRQDALAFQTA